jgi:predicted RNase H-like nuclease (RuvC/YqgF family)
MKAAKALLCIVFTVLFSRISPAQDSSSRVTYQDIQKLRSEVQSTFQLYESLLNLCQASKAEVTSLSLQTIDENLRELDRIKYAVYQSNQTIDQLTAIRADLLTEIAKLQKSLRQIKRRAWLERSLSTAIIATLSYFLITNQHPP